MLTDTDRSIHRSGDSGKSPLLCAPCEGQLNENFDKKCFNYLVSLRSHIRSKSKTPRPTLKNELLQGFIASIIWRASISKAKLYEYFLLPQAVNQIMREMLLKNVFDPRLISCEIYNLVDRTPVGGFDSQSLSDIILLPRQYMRTKGKKKNNYVYFVFQGFLFRAYLPGLSPSQRRGAAILADGRSTVRAPDFDIFDLPDFLRLGVLTVQKTKLGKVTF